MVEPEAIVEVKPNIIFKTEPEISKVDIGFEPINVSNEVKIQQEDIAMCKAISEYGLSLLKEGDGVLTHCNAGPLATSRYGTAIGPMLMAKEKGINISEAELFAGAERFALVKGGRSPRCAKQYVESLYT